MILQITQTNIKVSVNNTPISYKKRYFQSHRLKCATATVSGHTRDDAPLLYVPAFKKSLRIFLLNADI